MKRKIPETITEKEFVEIIKATKKKKKRLAYMLGFYQCMRVSEVVNLKKENVYFKRNYISIKNAKGNKDRDIPIIKPLLLKSNQMKLALKYLPIDVGIRALQYSFKKKAKEVLNKDLHFHTLRHSGAVWLLQKKKWDIRQVQVFLGHEKIQTTTIYLKIGGGHLTELEWGEE